MALRRFDDTDGLSPIDEPRGFAEREEFQPVSPDMLSLGLERFWRGRE